MHTTHHRLLPALLASLGLLSGCSPSGDSASNPAAVTTPIAITEAYAALSAEGKGFTVGTLMAANAVYVLFDPQCPHCGHLWEASLALHGKVKFVWLPVAFNQGKSLAQAATLLSATDPLATMTEHEKLLLSGKGGITAIDSVSPELAQSIKTNTNLMTTLGIDSVPFVLGKNRRTGEIVSNSGAMPTPALAQLLGVD